MNRHLSDLSKFSLTTGILPEAPSAKYFDAILNPGFDGWHNKQDFLVPEKGGLRSGLAVARMRAVRAGVAGFGPSARVVPSRVGSLCGQTGSGLISASGTLDPILGFRFGHRRSQGLSIACNSAKGNGRLQNSDGVSGRPATSSSGMGFLHGFLDYTADRPELIADAWMRKWSERAWTAREWDERDVLVGSPRWPRARAASAQHRESRIISHSTPRARFFSPFAGLDC